MRGRLKLVNHHYFNRVNDEHMAASSGPGEIVEVVTVKKGSIAEEIFNKRLLMTVQKLIEYKKSDLSNDEKPLSELQKIKEDRIC
eukprot:12709205-Ditylum_brightwellii.AAC.1